MLVRSCTHLSVAAFCLLAATGLTTAQQPEVRMVTVEGEGAKYWPVWRGRAKKHLLTLEWKVQLPPFFHMTGQVGDIRETAACKRRPGDVCARTVSAIDHNRLRSERRKFLPEAADLPERKVNGTGHMPRFVLALRPYVENCRRRAGGDLLMECRRGDVSQ